MLFQRILSLKVKPPKKTIKLLKQQKKLLNNLKRTRPKKILIQLPKKVKAVKNKKVKKQLKKRIATVKTAIETQKQEETAQAAAETAVANLEANQTRENVDDAKNKVDAVTDTAKKGDFNNRINAVVSAIETKEAEEAAQAEEARKAEEARQAQEQAAAEEAARQAQEQAAAQQVQQQAASGYSRDARGRWHRPNGQYASKAEIAAAGLPW